MPLIQIAVFVLKCSLEKCRLLNLSWFETKCAQVHNSQIVSSQDLHALFEMYAENFRVGGRSLVGPATKLYLVVPIYLLQALFCPDNYEWIFVVCWYHTWEHRHFALQFFFLKPYIMSVCKVHWQHLKQVVFHTVALPFTSQIFHHAKI